MILRISSFPLAIEIKNIFVEEKKNIFYIEYLKNIIWIKIYNISKVYKIIKIFKNKYHNIYKINKYFKISPYILIFELEIFM